MIGIRQLCVLFVLVALFITTSKTDQGEGSDDSGAKAVKNDLRLTITGSKAMATGHRGAFRIYAAPDGTEAAVSYTTFESLRDANREIKEWLKLTEKITSKEQKNDLKGRGTGTRIMAIMRMKSGTEGFLIIRRKGLDCYFIKSHSLPVAKQVEDLIE